MATDLIHPGGEAVMFDTELLDLPSMVGRPLVLYSEQFPGKPLPTRVIEASGNSISLDRGGADRQIDNLVHNQKVTIKFEYKGQQVSAAAVLKRTGGGKCRILLGEKAVPLVRRRFFRADMDFPVRFAVLNIASFHASKLGQLRWLETEAVNLSGGGILLELTSRLETNTLLFLSLVNDRYDFPALMLGVVRHCWEPEAGHFSTGVEFLTDNLVRKCIPSATMAALPSTVSEFTAQLRADMNRKIIAWEKDNGHQ